MVHVTDRDFIFDVVILSYHNTKLSGKSLEILQNAMQLVTFLSSTIMYN